LGVALAVAGDVSDGGDMIDPHDNSFAAQLERMIGFALGGDQKTPGLYQSILAAQTWDEFVRMRAAIVTYQTVLNMMKDVSKRINKSEGAPDDEQVRPGLN
jgi:hypothetical protein